MGLTTLGGLRLEGSAFGRPKALLLLAYLALEGPQERGHLAELFWLGRGDVRGNLAATLSRLRKAAPDLVGGDGVRVWADVDTDAKELEAAAAAGEIERVLELYRGPFLDGVHPRGCSAELEEWLLEMRERLASHAREALVRRAEGLAARGEFEAAAGLAAEALALRGAPAPELEVLERLYALLRAVSHPHASTVQKDAEGLGVRLALGVEEARKQLRRPQWGSFRHKGLPAFTTPFVGRREELAAITTHLADPTCRLLTLLGQGGMGKTRLALEAVDAQLDAFRDGVVFASFVSASSIAEAVFTLGDALGYSFQGRGEPLEQVLAFLADRHLLLVLDNLEHLPGGARLVHEMLGAAPGVKVLATSREALRLSAERVLALRGLPTPGESSGASELAASDAVELFVQCARNRQPEFALDARTGPLVARLCWRVGGMPLALELAATWLRALSLKDVVLELAEDVQAGDLDLLKAPSRDLPARHRSLTAVLDRTWERLNPNERAALRRLAVFHGGFDRHAAKEVAGVALPLLADLIDKSLLTLAPGGRYQCHPLVLGYSRRKLADRPEERERAERAHALYFFGTIRRHAPAMRTLERRATLERLEPDLLNVKAAWTWAVDGRRVEALVGAAEALSEVFGNREREAAALFAQAVAALDASDPEHHRALGRALVYQARQENWLGNHGRSRFLARESLTLLRRRDDKRGIIQGLLLLADFTAPPPVGDEQAPPIEAALELARRHGTPADVADCLFVQLLHERNIRPFAEVVRHCREALAEVREWGDHLNLAGILTCLGAYLVYNGRVDEGRRLLLESLDLNRRLDVKRQYICLYAELGFACLTLGERREAEAYFLDSLQVSHQVGNACFQSKSLGYLARLAVARGDRAAARDYLCRVYDLAAFSDYLQEAYLGLADYLAAVGDPASAAAVLHHVLAHPHTEKRDRDQARAQLGDLEAWLPTEVLAAARERGRALEPAEVVEELRRAAAESPRVLVTRP